MFSSVFMEEPIKKVTDIPLGRIEPNPDQPRRFFDIESLTELAKSIDEYGVIQPITVKKKSDGRFIIIAGERRYRASCMAKKKTIPAIIIDVSEEKSAAIALLENLQRKDLTFFEEAEGYLKLMNEYDMTQEELSEKLGKSQSTIANKVRLLKLDEETRQSVFDAHLTERHARALLKLPNKKVREKAIKLIVERNLTVAKAEKLIDKMASGDAESRRFRSFKTSLSESIKRQRVFCSTMNKTIGILNKAGVETEIEQTEDEEKVKYVICIAK
ncbi:MAG: ParB/RepB/Spo0J family partition protein [Clostridia bacterium]|nr:ParB/RepB/Spo0J family partition protein [Clostridia bacterium]